MTPLGMIGPATSLRKVSSSYSYQGITWHLRSHLDDILHIDFFFPFMFA
jgi:hypothetical protein